MVKTVSEIIKELIEANDRNETVDLNKLKCKASAKYGLPMQPRLTDIISAVRFKIQLIEKTKEEYNAEKGSASKVIELPTDFNSEFNSLHFGIEINKSLKFLTPKNV